MQSLREIRKRRVWSIRDLAKAAGVSPRTVLLIEQRKIRPRYKTIRKLAEALEVEPLSVQEFSDTLEDN